MIRSIALDENAASMIIDNGLPTNANMLIRRTNITIDGGSRFLYTLDLEMSQLEVCHQTLDGNMVPIDACARVR